jgi:tRNA1(Val) A37 N6-methylase TrmN6
LKESLPTEKTRLSLTDDAFLGGALSALQPARGFRAGIDSVLLAASVPAEPGARLIEPGMGAGIAALCLARRVEGAHVAGLEVDPALAALARRNAARNGMENRIIVLDGDVATPPPGLKRASFDHAFANPPFHEDGSTLPAADESLDRARRGEPGLLSLWLNFCLDHVRDGGTVSVIQRAERLATILSVLEARAGALRLFPLWPRRGIAAKRIIVCARKGARAPLALLPGLVLHEEDGRYTPEAEAILRHGAPLPLV